MLLVCLSAMFGSIFFWTQSQILYHPDTYYKDPREEEKCLELQVRDVFFHSKDGTRLHGQWLPARNSIYGKKYPTILFCHGNSGTVHDSFIYATKLNSIPNRNVFIWDYRGYGQSEGVAHESGLKLDSEAAFEFAWSHPSTETTNFTVYGHSLGGGVAFYLGNRFTDQINFLIIENSFYSIPYHLRVVMPPFLSFLGEFIFERWESWKDFEQMLKKSNHPKVLLMRGERDNMILEDNINKLEQLALKYKKQPVEIEKFPEGEHGLVFDPTFVPALMKFFNLRTDNEINQYLYYYYY